MNDSASIPNTSGRAAWICLAIAWVCFLTPLPGLGFIGWPLNLTAFILAIVAMSKSGALAGLFQLLASLIASPIIYFIGFAIYASIVTSDSTIGAAYDDYKVRANVMKGMVQAESVKSSIGDFVKANASLPRSGKEIDISYSKSSKMVQSISVRPQGLITLTFAGPSEIDGKTVEFTPTMSGDKLSWSCNQGSLESRYRPKSCR